MTMTTERTPEATTSRKPTREMNKLMDQVLIQAENQVCADCPQKKPLWVSYLSTIPGGGPKRMGVLVCSNCARRHHFELGEKRCHIHYLKMVHEFSLQDVETLQQTGNAAVNRVFEGTLTKDVFDKELVLDDEEQEDERRSKYIKAKYRKHQYKDPTLYQELMVKLLKICQPKPEEQERDVHEESTRPRIPLKPDRSTPARSPSNTVAIPPISDHSKEDSRSDRSSRSSKNLKSLSPTPHASRKEGRRRGVAASKSPCRGSHDPHTQEDPPKHVLRRGRSCSNLLDRSFGDHPSTGLERSGSSSTSLHGKAASSRVEPPPRNHSGTEKRDSHSKSDLSHRKSSRRSGRGASHHSRSSTSPKPTSRPSSRTNSPRREPQQDSSRMVPLKRTRSSSCPNRRVRDDERNSNNNTITVNLDTDPLLSANEGTTAAKESDRIPTRRTALLKKTHSDSKLVVEEQDQEFCNPQTTPRRTLSRRQLLNRASSTSNLLAARTFAAEQQPPPNEHPKRVIQGASLRTTPRPNRAATRAAEALARISMRKPSSSPNLVFSSAEGSTFTSNHNSSNRNAQWTAKPQQPSRQGGAMPYVKKTIRSIADLDAEETPGAASAGHSMVPDGSATRGLNTVAGRRTMSSSGLARMRATLTEHRSNSRRSLGARTNSARSLIG